ncbi:ATP-binding protein [Patescibacteria group bacterium]|nr:ATP-binding protein [Patescibacteria group bacterium]
MDKNLIKRGILEELKRHLDKKEITLLAGPRQAGKTTLMNMMRQYLAQNGQKTLFLNLDFEENKKYFVSQGALLKKIELEFGKEKGFIFIDEIQRKENSGVFLKGIYDFGLPHKLIVSGSGSLELKEKIHESLAGRKMIFEINPISFSEFVDFKTDYRYSKRLLDFFEIEKDKTSALLDEYMNFGGYPRLILEETAGEKTRIIDEIFKSYLERDISYWLGVEKTEAFAGLVKILAQQTGGLVNYAELSGTLGISYQTVKNFLWYLEKTFIIRKVAPYFRNKRKEITKTPIFYFVDLGLRNYSQGIFGRPDVSQTELGLIFENFVFNILMEKLRFTGMSIHFWRTKEGAEVDFVADSGKSLLPIEVKFQQFKEPKIERSLRSFIEKYQPARALIITNGFKRDLPIGKTKVEFLPFWETLDDNFK